MTASGITQPRMVQIPCVHVLVKCPCGHHIARPWEQGNARVPSTRGATYMASMWGFSRAVIVQGCHLRGCRAGLPAAAHAGGMHKSQHVLPRTVFESKNSVT
ncbi:hypothetical protein TorRG33x02_048100 [Trema orientale]|uniref:Uncharacterized protein n=1 Tax=Trema orientale TaxID=63057 RepID=A0A2P5FN79_TREOI|nr:hypothetical protein TorRG33x02_048100 [Trema orientale]